MFKASHYSAEGRSALGYLTIAVVLMAICTPMAYGWGSGHGTEARIVMDALPKEIKDFFSPELQNLIIRKHCMYPDTIKSFDVELLGQECVDETVRLKLIPRSLHFDYNIAICFTFLTRAFAENNPDRAAVWLGALIHAVGDNGSHLGPITYLKETTAFKDVKSNKGCSEISQIDNAAGRANIKKLMDGFEPKAYAGDSDEVIKRLIVLGFEQMDYGSLVTDRLSYTFDLNATQAEIEDGQLAMAELGAFQIKSMLNAAVTAWQFAKEKKAVNLNEEIIAEGLKAAREWVKAKPLSNDTVYAGTLDSKPAGPAIGVVVEPSVCMGKSNFGYCAQIVQAQIMRTLIGAQVPYIPLDIRTIEKDGLPSVDKVPAIIIVSGSFLCSRPPFEKYVKEGGKVIYIAGRDQNLLGKLSASLKPANVKVLPVSMKYDDPNTEVMAKASVKFLNTFELALGKDPLKFVNNPNTGGWTTPRCGFEIISDDPDIQKLVSVSNGEETITVAGALMESGKARHIFMPQYLLWVRVLTADETVSFSKPELDSLGRKLILSAVTLLTPELMPKK